MVNSIIAWQDAVNGAFELFVGLTVWFNIRQLHRDKECRGVHLLPSSLFCLWSLWNIYYYPHLEQWLSFSGGLIMATLNVVWISQMIYYIKYPMEKPSNVS